MPSTGSALTGRSSPRPAIISAVTARTNSGACAGTIGAGSRVAVTRSGTSRFEGSAYEYHRNPGLNTNYWFNENAGLGKNQVTLNQYGFRQGASSLLGAMLLGRDVGENDRA